MALKEPSARNTAVGYFNQIFACVYMYTHLYIQVLKKKKIRRKKADVNIAHSTEVPEGISIPNSSRPEAKRKRRVRLFLPGEPARRASESRAVLEPTVTGQGLKMTLTSAYRYAFCSMIGIALAFR